MLEYGDKVIFRCPHRCDTWQKGYIVGAVGKNVKFDVVSPYDSEAYRYPPQLPKIQSCATWEFAIKRQLSPTTVGCSNFVERCIVTHSRILFLLPILTRLSKPSL